MIIPRNRRNAVGFRRNPYKASFKQVAAGVVSALGGGYLLGKRKAAASNITSIKRYKVGKKNFAAVKQEMKEVKKKVKKIYQRTCADKSLLTYRVKIGKQLAGASDRAAAITSDALISDSYLDNAMAQLVYFDPSNPATPITADLGPTTANQSIAFKRIYAHYWVRNNYKVAVMVRMYLCRPRKDTSTSPANAFTNGLADIGNPSSTSTQVRLTDSPHFHELWKIEKSKTQVVQAGSELHLSWGYNKNFCYESSIQDSHPSTYRSDYPSLATFVQIIGVCGHDHTTTTQVGHLLPIIDIMGDITIEIEYDSGGPAYKRVVVSDTTTAPTNYYVTSNKPVANNQNANGGT